MPSIRLRVIVELLDFFGLSISQLCISGLQHLIAILVLGYERGMVLSADYLEAMQSPKRAREGYYYLSPRTMMSIIEKFTSNGHNWEEFFFYVRIDSASVEESCILLFRSEWGKKGYLDSTFLGTLFLNYNFVFVFAASGLITPETEDLEQVKSLLLHGPYYWGHFSPKRVRRAVTFHFSHSQQSEPVEVESEPGWTMFRGKGQDLRRIHVFRSTRASGVTAFQRSKPATIKRSISRIMLVSKSATTESMAKSIRKNKIRFIKHEKSFYRILRNFRTKEVRRKLEIRYRKKEQNKR